MTKLKICPFCGSKAELEHYEVYWNNAVRVRCTECSAESKSIIYNAIYKGCDRYVINSEAKAVSDVVAAWNKRVSK